jgi:diguanylate cyclase (GGDEF)-like protein
MKVLVVDDDPVSLMLAATVVETLGHDVSTASSGVAAWEALERAHYDVLVTDREMPGLDGLALCERVRARASSGLPAAAEGGYCYVVILTGHDSAEEAYAGICAGADDYLTKPLNGHELRLRLVSAQRVTDMHRRLSRQHQELNAIGEAQHALARRDVLTMLPNRLALQEHLDRLDANARRYGNGFSLAVLDIDHFKSVNDVAGHASGDEVLRRLATTLLSRVRETDGLYRFGGEEFVHVIETASPTAAHAAVERLRAAVGELALPHEGRPGEQVTLSAGVATSPEGAGVSSQVLLEQADAALYLAKQAGRDRTRSHGAPDDDPQPPAVPVRPRPSGAARVEGRPGGQAPAVDPAPLQRMHELGRQIGRHLADEIVQTWLRQSGQTLTVLQVAVRDGDPDTLRTAAHTLKGSSGTVGATALAAVCRELEDHVEWADCDELVQRAGRLLTPTNDALRGLLRSLELAATTP